MVAKLLTLFIACIVLSSCTLTSTNNSSSSQSSLPESKVSAPTLTAIDSKSDQELLKSLENDQDQNFDSHFKALESDLK